VYDVGEPNRSCAIVVESRGDDAARYTLAAPHLLEYRDTLHQIAAWMAAQRALSQRRGFSARGWVVVTSSPSCPGAPDVSHAVRHVRRPTPS
jgi:hypothetical protein